MVDNSSPEEKGHDEPCPFVEYSSRFPVGEDVNRTNRLLPEPISVFTGDDERLDHFRSFEVTFEFVQLVQPEMEASVIRLAP